MNLTPDGDWWIIKLLNCRPEEDLSGIRSLARARGILYENDSHLQPWSCGLAIKRRTNCGLTSKGSRDLDPLPPSEVVRWLRWFISGHLKTLHMQNLF
jgi:hypothetical protein